MKHEEVNLEQFSVVGISVRTINKDGKAAKDIAKLWDDFKNNNIQDEINNRLSDDIYCIYSDYESDKDGEYTVIIGYKVNNTNDITGEFDYKDIPAGKYYKFVSEGTLPESVTETWKHIWQSDIKRAYYADFEVYSPETLSLERVMVPTYLSVE